MSARLFSLAFLTASPLAFADGQAGRASVDWLSASATAEPGKPLHTVIRMVMDEGWYTYWINPGDAGMKTTFEWKLPAGWTAGPPAFPVPSRFVSEGLASLGYKGTVLFPVTLAVPVDFNGPAKLRASVSWLACSSDGCIPGEAEVEIDVRPGPVADGPDAARIEEARLLIPQSHAEIGSNLSLSVAEADESMVLTIRRSGEIPFDPADCDAFPVTPQVVDPGAEIRFTADGDVWRAEVPKSEYFTSPPDEFTLVLAPKKPAPNAGAQSPRPIELTWSVGSGDQKSAD